VQGDEYHSAKRARAKEKELTWRNK
jgi:hypothetical protein